MYAVGRKVLMIGAGLVATGTGLVVVRSWAYGLRLVGYAAAGSGWLVMFGSWYLAW